MTMKRGFRRSRAERPSVQWLSLSPVWNTGAVAATTAVSMLQLEAPTLTGAVLTATPSEELTLIRIVGDFLVLLSAAASSWTLALMVNDATWTPGATFTVDADKRVLWHQTYVNLNGAGALQWTPPGIFNDLSMAPREAVHLDINPKVRLEPGKALYLILYENSGAGTLTTLSNDMRVLYSRAKRR